ncbi:MAG: hypothetical protein ETSY1_31930 [Candidatus Entotheonella factor]|uniref:DUF2283 domain-containing protein n=1 Tax=Entotheonella factor TaxID=1429438 RepID=W4LB11_ENTF1|nr:DUF2283 domain-containing protein [Candidatus Entotheonella palauensis]ETW95119.1 MAG: hypothetical protein ETSY1_31930 [Candidatus Entotheonella factor]
MKSTRLTYDPEGDILYITFGQSTPATGYQLSDQILLRVNPQTQQAAGLMLSNFSIHLQENYDLPLPGLNEEPETKAHLLHILQTAPVNHFLQLTEDQQDVSARLRHPTLQEALVG